MTKKITIIRPVIPEKKYKIPEEKNCAKCNAVYLGTCTIFHKRILNWNPCSECIKARKMIKNRNLKKLWEHNLNR